eukprot:GEMP01134881.1.p1 GENE.GEMP01134881.1~~GEMP01134881.1.p1  ORF type:complete len:122 (+),score=14.33 GEMP01134881.1:28-393(+)
MGSRTLQRPVVALLGGIPLIIVWALGSLSWFWFHPVMMAISMFPLAGNAILLKKIGGYQNTKYHRYLMMLCTASMCFAWYSGRALVSAGIAVSLLGLQTMNPDALLFYAAPAGIAAFFLVV